MLVISISYHEDVSYLTASICQGFVRYNQTQAAYKSCPPSQARMACRVGGPAVCVSKSPRPTRGLRFHRCAREGLSVGLLRKASNAETPTPATIAVGSQIGRLVDLTSKQAGGHVSIAHPGCADIFMDLDAVPGAHDTALLLVTQRASETMKHPEPRP